MKKVLLLIIIIGLSALQAFPQSSKITGHVFNQKGQVIDHASVRICKTDHHSEVDKNGRFILSTSAGEYELSVSAIGYKSQLRRIKVHDNENINQVFYLEIDPSTNIDQVVVQGKSAVQKVRETPFNVVAIDAKSQYNSTLDLAHLLDKASGVKIRETGGVGSDMNITLNGFTGRNIRVFIDGVPMEGMGSAFQLNNIPVNAADRIEIYKGVVPIEFGSDALGGVINIVTNQSANTSLDASYSYGSFNTQRSNLSLNHTFKSGVSLQLNAFQNYSDNNYNVKTSYRIFAKDNSPGSEGDNWQTGSAWSADSSWFRRFHDHYRNETLIAKVGVVGKKWADRMLFGLTMGQVHRDIQHGSEMRYVFGERTAFSKSILPSFVYDKRNLLIEGLSVRATGNYNYEKAGSIDTSAYKYSWDGSKKKMADLRGVNAAYGEASLGMAEYSNSNQSASLGIGYRINKSHSVSINNNLSFYSRKPNLESIANDLYPELPNAADSMTRTSLKNSLGFEYRFTFRKKWNTIVFGKHYLNRATGPQTNEELITSKRQENASKTGYGIASNYFYKDFQFKASAEKAYRLPNDRELFGDELLDEGNITLQPEESNNYNLGITFNKEISPSYSLFLDWAGYHRDTYNFIQRLPGRKGDAINGETVFQNRNHGRVTRWGTDFEARLYYKNRASIGGTFTYMDIRDKAPFSNLAETQPNGNYGYRMPNLPYFFWNVDATYYFHNLFGKGNTLNLNYTLNFVDKIYLHSYAYADRASKAIVPQQLYSDFSASYMLKNGKYNISVEARNLADAMLYDNYSLQKPGRSFAVKLRYYFIKRNNSSIN
ncbi:MULTISPECIES: TonB-dependent receptor plug domain-containing protein [unclassified Sphingobacterium]|uniref:TonB-dependent receptor n=1 Tax=unclassified Sphingobacterium TaxID=2609468 RepID=UPI0020C546C9|nr:MULTISPECIES: TonB-dependent receptor plug domain-containing protein [unclassified Sphingobacterium]